MARKKSRDLTDAELRLMEVVWRRGPSTVGDVAQALGDPPLAYNTVLTMLRILEDKGYLKHSKPEEGRAFVYHPVVDRNQASQNAVRNLVGRFFGDSPGDLVLNLLENERLSQRELRRIRQLITEESEK